MTIAEYYKGFVSVFGGLTALASAFPLVSKVLPEDKSQWLFPPLGNVGTRFSLAALMLAWGSTVVVYSCKDAPFMSSKTGRPKTLVWLVGVACIGAMAYLAMTTRLVVSVEIPAEDRSIAVSVGLRRSEFAKREFSNVGDIEMLRKRGATEEDIQKLWTEWSIIGARVALLGSYLLLLLPVVAVGSFAVLGEQLGAAPNP